jgi:cytosine permease
MQQENKASLELQNWLQLSSIQIGGTICLPVIIIGQTLSQTYGFYSAAAAIFLGNLLLLLLGFVSSKMSYERRKNTMENARDFFGKWVVFLAFSLLLCVLGWFAIQLNMMSLSVLDLFSIKQSRTFWLFFSNLALGLIMTFAGLKGLKAINFLANVSLPLLAFTLIYALFTAGKAAPAHEQLPFSLGGISLVMALAVGVVLDLPTFFRHAATRKDGYLSIFIIFGLSIPFLEMIGVYLANGMGGTILDVLKREDSFLWNIWIACFLILAGWTTNNLNLYSGVVCLESIFENSSEKSRNLCLGLIGTALSCFNLINHLEVVLDGMGIFVSSMGSVILTSYLLYKQVNRGPASYIFAWIVGIIIGFLSMAGYSLTGMPVLDAMIGASLGMSLTMIRERRYEKIQLR